MSKTEDKIQEIFQSAGIPCIREKTFPDLKKGQLRFDFYLPTMNVLVEYDSEIHFQKVPKFHRTYNDFSHAQENDRIKNSYALAHLIPLYRVPYWTLSNIKTVSDILSPQFLVKSKWHNDIVYREYKMQSSKKK